MTDLTGWGILISAVGSSTAGIITALTRRTVTTVEQKVTKTAQTVESHSAVIDATAERVEHIHDEIKTSDECNHTVGQLIEQNLPPTLDNSPAPVRVANDHPAGRLQTPEEIVAGQNDSPGQ